MSGQQAPGRLLACLAVCLLAGCEGTGSAGGGLTIKDGLISASCTPLSGTFPSGLALVPALDEVPVHRVHGVLHVLRHGHGGARHLVVALDERGLALLQHALQAQPCRIVQLPFFTQQ